MPELYCEECKKMTPHKSLMRRSREEEVISFTQKFAWLIGQISTGKNHYKLEKQHFCRYCNCQSTVTEEKMVLNNDKPIMVATKPGQLGAL